MCSERDECHHNEEVRKKCVTSPTKFDVHEISKFGNPSLGYMHAVSLRQESNNLASNKSTGAAFALSCSAFIACRSEHRLIFAQLYFP